MRGKAEPFRTVRRQSRKHRGSRETYPKGLLDVDDLEMMILGRDLSQAQPSEARARIDALKSDGPRPSSGSGLGIEPTLQLQRVLLLARENQFRAAGSLALKMRPNSITDLHRGTALRITALLQTRQNGLSETLPWSRALVDIEDRAYALLGISQALLEIDDLKLGYSAIMVH